MPQKTISPGYLIIDHRNSPGITAEEMKARGWKGPCIGAGETFEADTFICGHCQSILIKNPLRIRARGYCPKCDSYVCDTCEAARVASGICKPYEKSIDEQAEFIITRKGLR